MTFRSSLPSACHRLRVVYTPAVYVIECRTYAHCILWALLLSLHISLACDYKHSTLDMQLSRTLAGQANGTCRSRGLISKAEGRRTSPGPDPTIDRETACKGHQEVRPPCSRISDPSEHRLPTDVKGAICISCLGRMADHRLESVHKTLVSVQLTSLTVGRREATCERETSKSELTP